MSYSVDDALAVTYAAINSPNVSLLQSALKTCQIALEQERNTVKHLSIELETLKVASHGSLSHLSSSDASKQTGQVAWLSHLRLLPYKVEIVKHAKKFGLLRQIWPDEDAFLKPRPSSPIATLQDTHVSKDAAAEAYTQYSTLKLYPIMPNVFHAYIGDLLAFRDAILYQVQSMRSTGITNLRKFTPLIFAGLGVQDHCSAQSYARSKDQSCLSLISNNPHAQKLKYNLFCPIIYADIKGKKPIDMFLNIALMKIGRFLLFGPGSLSGKVSPNASGMKWGPIKTTSGLISASVNMFFFYLEIQNMLRWVKILEYSTAPPSESVIGNSQEVDEQFVAQQSLMRATQQFTDLDDSEGEVFDWGTINSDDVLPGPTQTPIPNIPVFMPPDNDAALTNLCTTVAVNDPPQVPVQQSHTSQSTNSSLHSMRSTSALAQLIAFAPVILVSDGPDPAETVSTGLALLIIATGESVQDLQQMK
ncbi:hypothetical protein H0H92_007326 [Tricholoma furcatifolium]|nr:hypothetical protein H0H92_007326 [Tricholoma furcatifolium]